MRVQHEKIEERANRSMVSQAVQRKSNNTGLPNQLKSGIESLSGYSMDDVKVHYNSSKPAQLNAHAYAQGSQIHLASGQEKHLPHEAWHVVQQKQGRVRPTIQLQAKSDEEIIQKVEIPMTDTTGTSYTASKFDDEATVAMSAFAGLPGLDPTRHERDNFSWHHIIPQAHISTEHANNQYMIRLGPASSLRIDDPGHKYTDPNYRSDGTRTPVSASLEADLKPADGIALDHPGLRRRLDQTLSGHQTQNTKIAYSDPNQWFIPHDLIADNMTDAEKQKLAVNAQYEKDGTKHQIQAFSWNQLRKGGQGLSEESYNKVHAALKSKIGNSEKIFFRGFPTNKVQQLTFKIRAELSEHALSLLTLNINDSTTLNNEIKNRGKVLVFEKQIRDLIYQRNELVKDLTRSRVGGTNFRGQDEEYLSGTGAIVDHAQDMKARNIISDRFNKKDGLYSLASEPTKKKDEHLLAGRASEEGIGEVNEATLVEWLRKLHTQRTDLTSTDPTPHWATEDEKLRLDEYDQGRSTGSTKARKNAERNYDSLLNDIKTRTDLESFLQQRARKLLTDHQESRDNSEIPGILHIYRLRTGQNKLIDELNRVNQMILDYFSNAELVKLPQIDTNDFLKKYLFSAFSKSLNRFNIETKKNEFNPSQPSEIDIAIGLFMSDCHNQIQETLQFLVKSLSDHIISTANRLNEKNQSLIQGFVSSVAAVSAGSQISVNRLPTIILKNIEELKVAQVEAAKK